MLSMKVGCSKNTVFLAIFTLLAPPQVVSAFAFTKRRALHSSLKKCIAVLALAALLTGGVFAQEDGLFSAGVGGYFASDFGGGHEWNTGSETSKYKTPYFGGGGFLFLDATYAELSFGFFSGAGKITQEYDGIETGDPFHLSLTAFDIGLLGKYPIELGSSLSVFPLLGVNYRIIVSLKFDDEEDPFLKPADFYALWFKFGGGLDYAVTDNVYLRGNLLYGIRLPNKDENDAVANDSELKARLGHGLDVKIALGYKF
jgi:hypothetical protein